MKKKTTPFEPLLKGNRSGSIGLGVYEQSYLSSYQDEPNRTVPSMGLNIYVKRGLAQKRFT